MRQRHLPAGAGWRVIRIDPCVPDSVHLTKQRHVADPYLGAQKFRLAGAHFREITVDLGQNLTGLGRDIGVAVVADDTGEIDSIVVDHDLAHPGPLCQRSIVALGIPPFSIIESDSLSAWMIPHRRIKQIYTIACSKFFSEESWRLHASWVLGRRRFLSLNNVRQLYAEHEHEP